MPPTPRHPTNPAPTPEPAFAPGDCVALKRRLARTATPIPHEPGWRLSGSSYAIANIHPEGSVGWVVSLYPRAEPTHPLASDTFVMTPAWIIRMVDGTHKWVIGDDIYPVNPHD